MTRYFRSRDCRVVTSGPTQSLIYVPGTSLAKIVSNRTASLLLRCTEFETLEKHAIDFAAERPPGSVDKNQVAQELSSLVQMGFMIAHDELVAKIQSGARPDVAENKGGKITVLGVPTRCRPEALARCLESFIAATLSHSRQLEFVVIDNSTEERDRNACLALLHQIETRLNVAIRYIGDREKREFAEEIGRVSAIPNEAVDFCLFGSTEIEYAPGTNRNAFLLDTIGSFVLSADDDTVYRIAEGPAEGIDELCFNFGEPTEAWFFADRRELQETVKDSSEDLLALHERLLGKAITEVTAGVDPSDVEFRKIGPTSLGHLEAGAGTVAVSTNGLYGDTGMASSFHFLTLTGETRTRLLRDEASFRAYISSRQILRLVPGWTLGDGRFLMSTVLGLDNRSILPPFLPVLRGEDAVFGSLLKVGRPTSLVGHVPRAIFHDPTPSREGTGTTSRNGSDHSLSFILRQMTEGTLQEALEERPEQRWENVGRSLRRIASAPRREFVEWMRHQNFKQSAPLLGALNQLLRTHARKPGFWADELERHLVEEIRKLTNPPIDASDLTLNLGPERSEALTQNLLGRFGGLLEAWPSIWETSRQLVSRGIRISKPVGELMDGKSQPIAPRRAS